MSAVLHIGFISDYLQGQMSRQNMTAFTLIVIVTQCLHGSESKQSQGLSISGLWSLPLQTLHDDGELVTVRTTEVREGSAVHKSRGWAFGFRL